MRDASAIEDILDLVVSVPRIVLEGVTSELGALVVVSTAGADSAVVIGLPWFGILEAEQCFGGHVTEHGGPHRGYEEVVCQGTSSWGAGEEV